MLDATGVVEGGSDGELARENSVAVAWVLKDLASRWVPRGEQLLMLDYRE